MEVCEFLDLYCMVCCFLPFQIDPVWFGLMFYVTLCGGSFFRNKNLRGDFKESQSLQVFIQNSCSKFLFCVVLADAEREEAGSSSVHSGTTPSSSSTYEANNIPTSNYTGIHIPPGAHAPANTPAEVPHNTGMSKSHWRNPCLYWGHEFLPKFWSITYTVE